METVALVRTPDSHILKNSIIDKALYIVHCQEKIVSHYIFTSSFWLEVENS